jgi:hypothetical protein
MHGGGGGGHGGFGGHHGGVGHHGHHGATGTPGSDIGMPGSDIGMPGLPPGEPRRRQIGLATLVFLSLVAALAVVGIVAFVVGEIMAALSH